MLVLTMAAPSSTVRLARVARGTSALSRMAGRSGSVIGGRVVLYLDRKALGRFAAGRSVHLVSGTNGKTTTTALLTAALRTAGPVVTNTAGANLKTGLVAALVEDLDAPTAVLEVDEAALVPVLSELGAGVAVLLNLTRDQLDRYAEVRLTAARWRRALRDAPGVHVVANADDPLVVWAAGEAASTTWVAAGHHWRADASACPACPGRISWDLDVWSCRCGLVRPDPEVSVRSGALTQAGEAPIPLPLQLPGRCNLGNAAMAATAAWVAGVPPALSIPAMAQVTEVSGRYREVTVGSTRIRLLLAKNPAGWNEVFDDLLLPAPAAVVVAVNAQGPDGRDPSWLWDVDFERLRNRPVVTAGERALDLAARLHYAEVPCHVEPDPLQAVQALPDQQVDLVANYTAFRSIASRVGHGG